MGNVNNTLFHMKSTCFVSCNIPLNLASDITASVTINIIEDDCVTDYNLKITTGSTKIHGVKT